MYYALLLFLFFTAILTAPPSLSSVSSSAPDRFLKTFHRGTAQKEYIEVYHPLPFNPVTPSCILTVLRHSFANTINKPPFTAPYSPPPDCDRPWSRVILELHATCKGDQYDRIVGLWLGGSELLRTNTAEPTKSGIFWRVRKDVTRYSSLLAQTNLNVTMMLENVVNDVYTGVYHVNCTLFFYKDMAVRVPRILSPHDFNTKLGFESEKYYDPPADLIIPISGDGAKGYWFRIETPSDLPSKKVKFPRNAYRAVLEVYVSFHGNDEFWYSNPPNSYIKSNHLPTSRGNGNYREVFVTIDGKFIASEFPLPVIFSGGINPLLWEPVVAIGAFNLPSYDMELTPFLGFVLDGKKHEIGFGVNDGISFWLVNANLHIWLDHSSSKVQSKSPIYRYPNLNIHRGEAFKLLDGKFRIEAKRKTKVMGWVKSSLGNLTTAVVRQFRVENAIVFGRNGTYKSVNQKIRAIRKVEVRNEMLNLISHVSVRRRYPFNMVTLTIAGTKKDTYVLFTNISHLVREKCVGDFESSTANSQVSYGWMLVKDHSVTTGEANTKQSYSHRDEISCFNRAVAASNGKLVSDIPKFCAASS